MPSGEAPTVETSTVKGLLSREWSRRQPLPAGLLSLLTVVFWAVWLYLVAPLISLLLWVFGVRLFAKEFSNGGYEALLTSLAAYSAVLLILVGLLALWIAWNVTRYGGRHDRRTVKRAQVSDEEVEEAFHLDDTLLDVIRAERVVRVDLDRDDCVLLIEATSPQGPGPAGTAADGHAAALRDRLSA